MNPLDLFPDGASFLDGSGERYTFVGFASAYVVGSDGKRLEIPWGTFDDLIRKQPAIRSASGVELDNPPGTDERG